VEHNFLKKINDTAIIFLKIYFCLEFLEFNKIEISTWRMWVQFQACILKQFFLLPWNAASILRKSKIGAVLQLKIKIIHVLISFHFLKN